VTFVVYDFDGGLMSLDAIFSKGFFVSCVCVVVGLMEVDVIDGLLSILYLSRFDLPEL